MINGRVDQGESHDLEGSFYRLGSSLRMSVMEEKTVVPEGRYFSDLLGHWVMGEWVNPDRWLFRTAEPEAETPLSDKGCIKRV